MTIDIREQLAELMHNQWMEWSKEIDHTEDLDPARRNRWKKLWVPYAQLTEMQKDQDRVYADRIIEVVKTLYKPQ